MSSAPVHILVLYIPSGQEEQTEQLLCMEDVAPDPSLHFPDRMYWPISHGVHALHTFTKGLRKYATFDKGRKEGVCGLYIHKKVYKVCYV